MRILSRDTAPSRRDVSSSRALSAQLSVAETRLSTDLDALDAAIARHHALRDTIAAHTDLVDEEDTITRDQIATTISERVRTLTVRRAKLARDRDTLARLGPAARAAPKAHAGDLHRILKENASAPEAVPPGPDLPDPAAPDPPAAPPGRRALIDPARDRRLAELAGGRGRHRSLRSRINWAGLTRLAAGAFLVLVGLHLFSPALTMSGSAPGHAIPVTTGFDPFGNAGAGHDSPIVDSVIRAISALFQLPDLRTMVPDALDGVSTF